MLKIHDHLLLLRVQDEQTVLELQAVVGLEAYIQKKLSPTTFIIKSDSYQELSNKLQGHNYKAKLVGAPPSHQS